MTLLACNRTVNKDIARTASAANRLLAVTDSMQLLQAPEGISSISDAYMPIWLHQRTPSGSNDKDIDHTATYMSNSHRLLPLVPNDPSTGTN